MIGEAEEPDIQLFNHAVSPLLRLVSHLTGFETAFLTAIDHAAGQQTVLLAENSGRLQLPDGAQVDWSDSMCQLMFSQQLCHTEHLQQLFPHSKGVQMGMQSFVVLPVRVGDKILGTLCGADSDRKTIDTDQLKSLQLISEALALQLKSLLDANEQRLLAQQAQHKVTVLQTKVQDLAELANTDPLTQLLNRRGFQLRADDAAAQCSRSALSLAVMMIDIDHFKQFNDQHGHDLGDDIIKMIANGMKQVARTSDITCRLGGDEFVLLAIDTPLSGMQVLAERLVNYVRQQSKALQLKCTLSIGIAFCKPMPDSALPISAMLEQLMKEGDKALYQSKDAGRNRISVFTP